MVAVFRPPAPVLAPFVDVLWYVDEPMAPGRERRLPTGAMQIVVNLGEDTLRWYDGDDLVRPHRTHGAGLCGVVTRAIGIDTAEQESAVGVAFRPGGIAPFFGPPASALTEPVIGLDELWGRDGASLRERLLTQPAPRDMLATMERLLLDRLVRPLVPDPALAYAVTVLIRGAPVGYVVDRLGATPSTFQRRFRAAVGLAAKPFARVRRLQRVLASVGASAGDVDWAATAAAQGYFDQAHLINDFRMLTGVTPARYRPRSAGEHNHVPLG